MLYYRYKNNKANKNGSRQPAWNLNFSFLQLHQECGAIDIGYNLIDCALFVIKRFFFHATGEFPFSIDNPLKIFSTISLIFLNNWLQHPKNKQIVKIERTLFPLCKISKK